MPDTQPYLGSSYKLCLSFDVGTTFSGISYCILRPGQVPSIYSVTRYRDNSRHHTVARSKIPSKLFYDQSGRLRAVGAQVLNPDVLAQATEENWTEISWFKLLFTPETSTHRDIRQYKKRLVSILPSNKTECDVLADYLRYLYDCALEYIRGSDPDDIFLWKENAIDFVLSHPNEWGGRQQEKMKLAMESARLINGASDGNKVMFVTEGDACLHFCLYKENEASWNGVKTGDGVIIVDAGGGTVDVSAYNVLSRSPASFEELNVPETLLQGSQFVTFRLESCLLENISDHDVLNNIRNICEIFDEAIKPYFYSDREKCHIPFSPGSRDGVEFSGEEIAALFEPTISSVIEVIKRQRHGHWSKIRTVFLLGGFAASPWLFEKLSLRLRPMHIRLIRPDVQSNRAVAEGCISFYLENYVHFRIARFTYGVECTREFDHNQYEHKRRRAGAMLNPSGTPVLPNGYQTILRKGTRIADDREFSWAFVQESNDRTELDFVSCDISCYKGKAADPQWIDTEPELFDRLCTVHADVSHVPKRPLPLTSHYVHDADKYLCYFQQRFSVILLFGMTELKAQIRWYENKEERRSPAQVIFEKT